jgi:hypothetical protein
MIHTRLRLIELGLLAALGAAIGGTAAADPDCDSDDGDTVVVGDSDLNYVYFRGDDDRTSMSGNIKDIDRARRHRQAGEQVLWFREGGHEYVIRDPATLKHIDVTWKPVDELGEKMGKLGGRIGDIGRQQGEIGAQQGLLGTRQGALGVREATLSMRESRDSLSDATRAELAKQRQALQQQMRELEKQMRALEKPMRELGARMEPLNREMKVLSQKMKVASASATAELRAVFKRSIASGVARPVK